MTAPDDAYMDLNRVDAAAEIACDIVELVDSSVVRHGADDPEMIAIIAVGIIKAISAIDREMGADGMFRRQLIRSLSQE